MLRLCTMIFDDVFVADRNNRWEHHDSLEHCGAVVLEARNAAVDELEKFHLTAARMADISFGFVLDVFAFWQ